MKKLSVLALGAALVMNVCSCGSKSAANLEKAADSLSYGIGVMQGSRLAEAKAMGMYPELNELDIELYLKGINEAANSSDEQTSYYKGLSEGMQMKKSFEQMSEQFGLDLDFNVFITAYAQVLRGDTTLAMDKQNVSAICDSIVAAARVAKEQAELDSIANTPEAIANLEAGMAFLAAKEQEEGVQKTASGLLYKVIKEGNGKNFKASDRIELTYVGKFVNDSIFDQGTDVKFVASQMVPGFGEGLQLMSPGAKFILYIPSDLAYGVRGRGATMPSNSTLVFEVETKGLAK
ncbi:MAG: FKBP-type peptidyl-prolyl cis-trans isomerase [Bacteroidaceae bacterium]|nr:FKBP-type peptidyl-prolyl cis-trans isomerase [Bacteroidaceae bacterium]